MLLRLSILMIVVPLLELALLFQINKYVGLIPTIGIVVVTGFLGASLARYQGRNAWQNVQLAMKQGRMPSTEISEGILIFVAGLLLITPGLITDTTGFILLIPVFRRRVAQALQAWFRKNATVQFHSAASAFTSASAPFETYSDIETTDAQRPSVRVVDPSQGKLNDDT